MRDADCVSFLQWALPRLGMRWSGFRKVRRQVGKRVARRMEALGLAGLGDYRRYLESHPGEWPRLEGLCRITISRFFRDREVFEHLLGEVLPGLAAAPTVRVWSAGCGGGEEAYSVKIGWHFLITPRFPSARLEIVGTDADEGQLARAEVACYGASSLREVPADWRETAFRQTEAGYVLREEFRSGMTFLRQDIRREAPEGPFDVVLCRNLVFTYFDETVQRRLARVMADRLRPEGLLVLGKYEALPPGTEDFDVWDAKRRIYRRRAATGGRG